jgi:hypothetical protein
VIKHEKTKHHKPARDESEEYGETLRKAESRRREHDIDRALRSRDISELLESDDLDW